MLDDKDKVSIGALSIVAGGFGLLYLNTLAIFQHGLNPVHTFMEYGTALTVIILAVHMAIFHDKNLWKRASMRLALAMSMLYGYGIAFFMGAMRLNGESLFYFIGNM